LERAFKADRLHSRIGSARNAKQPRVSGGIRNSSHREAAHRTAETSIAKTDAVPQSARERACRSFATLSLHANLIGIHDNVTGDVVDDGLHHETKAQAASLADRALAIAWLSESKLPLVVDELHPVSGRAHGNCSRHPQQPRPHIVANVIKM
jgi:hypothetical protein